MRKFSIVLLSVLLLIVFVGCDLSVETMGKMGNNLAGTDKKYIANIIQQTEPEAAKKKTEDGKITIAGSNFSISASEGKGSILIAGEPVEVPDVLQTAINGVLTNSEFSSIILPTDISDIVLGVKSGSNSETIKKELEKKAEGASLEAAQGTVALVDAMLGAMKDQGEPEDEGFNKVLNDIKDFLPQEDSITNGDVVVLTALSNIVFNENVLSNVGIIMNEPPEGTPGDDPEQKKYEDAMHEVTGELMDQFSSLLDVVTNVPSGMSNKINDFINGLMDDSDNKEESK
ncbi:MAG: hypothetical protein ACI4M4_02835 [Candidatus Ornithospirochaeta sp.]